MEKILKITILIDLVLSLLYCYGWLLLGFSVCVCVHVFVCAICLVGLGRSRLQLRFIYHSNNGCMYDRMSQTNICRRIRIDNIVQMKQMRTGRMTVNSMELQKGKRKKFSI